MIFTSAERRDLQEAAEKPKKRPTFQAAKDAVLKALEAKKWVLKTRGPDGKPMKIPHATSPSGDVRLWFKPQALYFTVVSGGGARHEFKNARSLWVDIRDEDPAEFANTAEKQALKWGE